MPPGAVYPASEPKARSSAPATWDATAQPDLPTEVESRNSRNNRWYKFFASSWRISLNRGAVYRFFIGDPQKHLGFAPSPVWPECVTTSSHPHSALQQIHRSPICMVFICHLPTCPGNCSAFRGGLFTCVSSRAQAQGKSPLSASLANSACLTIPYGKKGSRASDTKQPGVEHVLKDARWVDHE